MGEYEKIMHLYCRAGFGLTLAEAERKRKSNVKSEVRKILGYQGKELPQVDGLISGRDEMMSMNGKEKNELRKKGRKLTQLIASDWIERMAFGDEPLLEKMCLFWHGHFACRTKMPHLATNQLNVIRVNALGNFRDLVVGIAKDASMIRYLNNQQNNKRKPNENFARELMELFTIGRGNYTEQDVKEAARAFTGWKSDFKGNFKFVKHQHDFGSKTFMGKTGNFDGTDVIDIILENKETARFITRKIYRYFVNPRVDERIVNQLTDTFYHSNYDIKKLMESILLSDWFYDEKNRGVRIKSPVELLAGMMKTLDITFTLPSVSLLFGQKALGQSLFNPPNVAGWAGGKAWIDNATLMLRLNLPGHFLFAKEISVKTKEEFESKRRNKSMKRLDAKINIQAFINRYRNKSDAEIIRDFKSYLLRTSTRVDDFIFTLGNNGWTQEEKITQILGRIMSLPEYQMS